MSKRRLAVFDIDGTLFRSSLLIELTKSLVEKNIFPFEAEDEIKKDFINWLYREAGYEEYISRVIEVYQKYIKGRSEIEVENTAIEVLRLEEKKLYRYTRDLISSLKNDGYYLFAISGSPGHILTNFAKDIGFDKYLGGYYEVVDGKFTGKQPYGNPALDKKKTLENFLDHMDIEFDLENSIGVGDTESDIAFLEMVGNPIAFNPNEKLAEHAKKRKWKIIVERKNVIYELKDFNMIKVD